MARRWPWALLLVAGSSILFSCKNDSGYARTPAVTPAVPSPVTSAAEPSVPSVAAPASAPAQIMIEGRLQSAASEHDAVREHASAFIPCPKDQITVRSTTLGRQGTTSECSPSNLSCWTFADGCGQRVVYGNFIPAQTGPHEYYVVSRFAMGHAAGGR